MSKMTKQDWFYRKLMTAWFAEHLEQIHNCQENAASARKIAKLNDEQVALHKQVLKVGEREYIKWLKQQNKKK